MKDETRKILCEALDQISPILTKKVPAFSDDLILWSGTEGLFDSIALVSFIGTVETMISEIIDKNITIVSEKAFSQQHSPFKTMETFGHFIEELLTETE